MQHTVFFGNGLNRISTESVSWENLLAELKGERHFSHESLPYTLVYERIISDAYADNQQAGEFAIKQTIAEKMKSQGSNVIFKSLAELNVENYITTNYDYAFQKALNVEPTLHSTEKLYSLRRKREYQTSVGKKLLWNIHGEIEKPKSIALGLDQYCGSLSKIDAYIKGHYQRKSVESMEQKLKQNVFCHTSWVDLFFTSHVHILGFGLDYSEVDVWWLLNKWARFNISGLVTNKIYFYTADDDKQKNGLLESFGIQVFVIRVENNDYESMYLRIVDKIKAQVEGEKD